MSVQFSFLSNHQSQVHRQIFRFYVAFKIQPIKFKHANNFLHTGIYAFYTIHTSLSVLTYFLQVTTFKKAVITFRACKEHNKLDCSDM